MQQTLREAVVETARSMNRLGINQGTSGNVSVRGEAGFVITPSGVPYDRLTAEGVVAVGMDGSLPGGGRPSSEWRFHRDIYVARPGVGAIVHTHSTYATTLACLGLSIPAFHYMVAVAGGHDIRCSDYATFGTQELSDTALVALEGRAACLLGQHGAIATGPDLRRALALAVELENLARLYWQVRQGGEPRILPGEEMERVLERFAGYGYGSG